MSVRSCLRGARAAAIFLTRIPLPGDDLAPADWRWAAAWFPAVGAALGLAQAAVFALLAPRAGPHLAAVLTVVASLMLTGAFHEDGLADTADAMGGAYTRERLFVILKDSRVGTFGSAALTCALLLRVLALARLDGAAPAALVVTQCISRVPPIWLMARMPYVTGDAEARSRLVTRARFPQVVLASSFGLLVLAAAVATGRTSAPGAVICVAVAAMVAACCGARFHARAGGVTGDFLGATQQLVEAALLLTLILVRGAR